MKTLAQQPCSLKRGNQNQQWGERCEKNNWDMEHKACLLYRCAQGWSESETEPHRITCLFVEGGSHWPSLLFFSSWVSSKEDSEKSYPWPGLTADCPRAANITQLVSRASLTISVSFRNCLSLEPSSARGWSYVQYKTMEEPEFARIILILDGPGLNVTAGC